MKRPFGLTEIVVIVIKAILIAGAILFLGRYFGLHVREAGGSIVAAESCASDAQST